MVKHEDMYLCNLSGVLHRMDTPLLGLEIRDRRLVHYMSIGWNCNEFRDDIGIGGLRTDLPSGLSYDLVNEFFRLRTIHDGAMWSREYFDMLGVYHYDFETIVKASCAWSPVDRIWLKYPGGRFQSYNDILNFKYD